MADPRPAPLSFRPPARVSRDDEFDERLFDQVALPPAEEGESPAEPDPAAVEEDEPPAAREGLPAGFRMRADAHYVDQVVSRRLADPIHLIPIADIDGPHPIGGPDLAPLVRSVARFGVLQPLLVRRRGGRYELISGVRRLAAAMAAGLSEIPCLVHFADDDKARDLAEATNVLSTQAAPASQVEPLPEGAFAELTEQLGAIDACLNLFREQDRPTRERVALSLIRTEVRRAAWLAQALALLGSAPPVASRPLDLASLVRQVVEALAAERAVTGVPIDAVAAELAVMRGDEQLLSVALAGILEAAQAAAERCAGAAVMVSVREDQGKLVVETSLAGAQLPRWLRASYLDVHAADRPGGIRAAVGIKAACRVAELHGGALTAVAGEDGVPRLVLTLPAA